MEDYALETSEAQPPVLQPMASEGRTNKVPPMASQSYCFDQMLHFQMTNMTLITSPEADTYLHKYCLQNRYRGTNNMGTGVSIIVHVPGAFGK